VDHGTETLRPALVLSKKDEAIFAGLSPLGQQMESQKT
jgi:hypothetical protein